MKKILLVQCFLLFFITEAQAQKENALLVNFVGLKSDTGAIYVGLHNKPDDFLKNHFRECVKYFKGNSVQVEFTDIPDGCLLYTSDAADD